MESATAAGTEPRGLKTPVATAGEHPQEQSLHIGVEAADSRINELRFLGFFVRRSDGDSICTSRKCYWMAKAAQHCRVTFHKRFFWFFFTVWACWRCLQMHVALVLTSGMNEIPFCLEYNASLWAGCRLTECLAPARKKTRTVFLQKTEITCFLFAFDCCCCRDSFLVFNSWKQKQKDSFVLVSTKFFVTGGINRALICFS